MYAISELTMKLLLPSLSALVGLAFVVLVDSSLDRQRKRLMLTITALAFSLVIEDWLNAFLQTRDDLIPLRTAVCTYAYMAEPVIILCFLKMVIPERRHRLAWALVGVNGILYVISLFNGICFTIREGNRFGRGPLGYTCHVICFALLLLLLIQVIRKAKGVRTFGLVIPLINALLLTAAIVADLKYYDIPIISFTNAALAFSCVFFYFWLHLHFVHEHEQAMKAEQRIQLMMSQIQPHFLYNTLSTIQALCETQPELAARTVEKFGAYLRQNLDSLSRTDLLPFDKELEHARIYAEIEMLMFPYITLTCDIGDRDFDLPALTVQPLVENAFRHGVRSCRQGEVSIITRAEEACHTVIIRDNGVGFDPEAVQSGSHIGLRNVRERIEQQCGGTLTVNSAPGHGTVVTICVPIEAAADDDGR